MALSTAMNTRTLAALPIPVLPVAPPLTMAPTGTSTASMGEMLEVGGMRMAHLAPALYVTLTTVVHTVR